MRNRLCPYTPCLQTASPHPKPNPLNPPQSQAILQGNITEINSRLRDIACSTAPATQVAAKANAEAFRRAISDQIVKVDLIGAIFARNKACNNPQKPAQLQRFANAVAAVDADDKKTAQAFTLLGGTLGCIL
ncbi:hypothetical protein XANCAGTX0491_000180 [Xanthoria calcicola]